VAERRRRRVRRPRSAPRSHPCWAGGLASARTRPCPVTVPPRPMVPADDGRAGPGGGTLRPEEARRQARFTGSSPHRPERRMAAGRLDEVAGQFGLRAVCHRRCGRSEASVRAVAQATDTSGSGPLRFPLPPPPHGAHRESVRIPGYFSGIFFACIFRGNYSRDFLTPVCLENDV